MLRKKIIYKLHYRGSKECEHLLIKYFKKRVYTLGYSELLILSNLLDCTDAYIVEILTNSIIPKDQILQNFLTKYIKD